MRPIKLTHPASARFALVLVVHVVFPEINCNLLQPAFSILAVEGRLLLFFTPARLFNLLHQLHQFLLLHFFFVLREGNVHNHVYLRQLLIHICVLIALTRDVITDAHIDFVLETCGIENGSECEYLSSWRLYYHLIIPFGGVLCLRTDVHDHVFADHLLHFLRIAIAFVISPQEDLARERHAGCIYFEKDWNTVHHHEVLRNVLCNDD